MFALVFRFVACVLVFGLSFGGLHVVELGGDVFSSRVNNVFSRIVPKVGFSGVGKGIFGNRFVSLPLVEMVDELDLGSRSDVESSEVSVLDLDDPVVVSDDDVLKSRFGEPVFVDGSSEVFKVDDRHFVTRISSDVKTFVDEDGDVNRVDLSLVSDVLGSGRVFRPVSSPVDVVLPVKVDSSSSVDVGVGEDSVGIFPLDVVYDKPVVRDNAVLYNNVDGDVDVQYTVLSDGVKEEIVLPVWGGKNVFRYGLDVDEEKFDVTLESGEVVVSSKDSGGVVFVLSAPVMVDGSGVVSNDVVLSLDRVNGRLVVVLTASKKWLSDTSRVFPVRIDPTVRVERDRILDVVTSSVHGRYQGRSYGYVGYLTAAMIGVPHARDIGRSRMYFKVNYDFSSIPAEARIDSASLNLYQYSDGLGLANATFGAYRMVDDFNIDSIDWSSSLRLRSVVAGRNAFSASKIGMHSFDIRDAVNSWVQGLAPNYGLVVRASREDDFGGAFYTTHASVANAGQIGFSPDKAPSITINWSVPNPVDVSFPLADTSVDLGVLTRGSRDGVVSFEGVFPFGVTTPASSVVYGLSDSASGYKGRVESSYSYKFPNTSSFEGLFPLGTNKFRDKLGNWQGVFPFTDAQLNKVYSFDVVSSKDGRDSGKKSSDRFLVYKVSRFDTLPKIASHYGVDVSVLAFDNRIQDMLLVEGNTLFIRNPSRNLDKPYNPGGLDEASKKDIDLLLMGRGLHCEFGFEPVNLNTGNFILERTDVSIDDFGGAFSVERAYNSKFASLNGLFGRGWSSVFDEQISKGSDGSVYYKRLDGSVVRFVSDGRGGFVSPDGYDLVLDVVKVGFKRANFGFGVESYPVFEYRVRDFSGSVSVFNHQGMLVSKDDSDGNTTKFDYDGKGQLVRSVSPSGKVYSFTYNDAGLIGSITVPNGSVLSYVYDDKNRLVSYKDALGGVTRYEYDSNGFMTAWFDPNDTRIVLNEYDEAGRVVLQMDPSGGKASFVYGDGFTITTDNLGRKTRYEVDESFRTKRILYPDGSSKLMSYDDKNHLVEEIDELGRRSSYVYDEASRIVSKVRFDGASLDFTYDGDNNLLSSSDYDGNTTRYEYDSKGNVVRVILPDGSVNSFSVDNVGRVISSVRGDGVETKYEYDGPNLVKIINPNGGVYSFSYDAHNNLVKVVDPLGGVSGYEYDLEGRKTVEFDEDNVRVEYSFDRAGNVVGVNEADGTTRFVYDGLGRKLRGITPTGKVYSYSYDLNGNLVGFNDGVLDKSFVYDERDRLIRESSDFGHVVYKYDEASRVVSKIDETGREFVLEYDDRFDEPSRIVDPLGQVTVNSYDVNGDLVEEVLPDKTSISYSYDVLGRLISQVDSLGRKYSFVYDKAGRRVREDFASRSVIYEYGKGLDVIKSCVNNSDVCTSYSYDLVGRVASEIDPVGAKTVYEYTKAGRVASITDPLGARLEYGYDSNGRQISVVDASGGKTVSVFDSDDNVISLISPLGGKTRFVYDNAGRLVSSFDEEDGQTNFEYDSRGFVTSVIDPLGGKVSYKYDNVGRVVEEVLPDNTSVSYVYDVLDRVVKQTSGSGVTTMFAYDKASNVIRTWDDNGFDEHYEYDKGSRLIGFSNSLGERTVNVYDEYDQLIEQVLPDKNVERYSYDVHGNLISHTDSAGRVSKYGYDKTGNVVSVVDRAGYKSRYVYDKTGQLEKMVDGLGGVTKYGYDVLGNLVSISDPENNTVSYGYDRNGNLIFYDNGNGAKSVYEYDKADRLTKIIDPLEGIQSYEYDKAGNVVSSTDANGNTSVYKYDKASRLIEEVLPNGGRYEYGYDNTGSVSSIVDPLGAKTGFVNDKYARLVKQIFADNSEQTYDYDVLDRVVKQTNSLGQSVSYKYDVNSNIVQEKTSSNRSTYYGYDKASNLVSVRNTLGFTTRYGYDNNDRLINVTSPKGVKTSYNYDANSNLTQVTSGMGVKTSYSYDKANRLINSKTNNRVNVSYKYDGAGNIVEQVDGLGAKTKYSYDKKDRLIKTTFPSGNSQSYGYDKADNLTNITNGNNSVLYSYDKENNLVNVSNGYVNNSYVYDKNSQLIKSTTGKGPNSITGKYSYDKVGNLTTITDSKGNITKYGYDKLSNLTFKTSADNKTTRYSYDENNNLSTVTKPDGQTIKHEYNKLNQLVKIFPQNSNDNSWDISYGYDKDGNQVFMNDASGISVFEYDKDGNITGFRQGNGKTIKYGYDKYGNLTKLTYPDGKQVSYQYDKNDQLISVIDTTGSKTTYDYNTNGDVTRIKRGDKTLSDIEYDTARRVTKITHKTDKYETISAYAYEYDPAGNISKETTLINGKTTINYYKYDTSSQLVEIKVSDKENTPKTTIKNTYNNLGNKTQTTIQNHDNNNDVQHIKYDYGNDNQLLKQTHTQNENTINTIVYEYDANGNRSKLVNNNNTNSFHHSYDYDVYDRLTSVKDTQGLLQIILYDGLDNKIFTLDRKTKNTLLPQWSNLNTQNTQNNNLNTNKTNTTTKPNNHNNNNNNDSDESIFWYAFNQTILQTLNVFGQTSGYLYENHEQNTNTNGISIPNNQGIILEENKTDKNQTLNPIAHIHGYKQTQYKDYTQTHYVNDINQEHSQTIQTYDGYDNTVNTNVYDTTLAPLNTLNHQTGQTTYNLTDIRSTIHTSTLNGIPHTNKEYDPYGSPQNTNNHNNVGYEYGYTGNEQHNQTGLTYLRARHYDPASNTFLTKDTHPINLYEPLTLTPYTYVENDPINNIDPTGHYKIRTPYNKNYRKNTSRATAHITTPLLQILGKQSTLKTPPKPHTNTKNTAKNHYTNTKQTTINHNIHHAYNKYHQTRNNHTKWGKPYLNQKDKYAKAWEKARKEAVRHVCETGKRVVKQTKDFIKNNWKNALYALGDYIGVNDVYTIITGKDILTGEKKSRWEALFWTAVSIIPAAGLAVKTYGKTIKNIVKATSKHLPQNITKTVKKTTQKITNTTRKTKNKINQIKNNTKQKITNTKNKITNGIGNTRNKIKEQIAQTIENMEDAGRVIVRQAMGLQPAYAHAGARNTRTTIRKIEPTPQAKDNVWARSANKNRSSNSRKSSIKDRDSLGNLYGVSKTPLDVIKDKTSEYTIPENALEHIIEDHMDKNHNPTKTKFVDDISEKVLKQLIEKVMNDPDRIVRYNTEGRTGYIVTAKVDRVLAVDKGENLYRLKIVIDENINVGTAYAIR